MNFEVIIGFVTVFLGTLLIVLTIIGGIKLYYFEAFDIQFIILYISILLLNPIIFLENLLFLDFYFSLNLTYSIFLAKFVFGLAVIGYYVYIIHLLSVEDFPITPLSFIAVASGFALGTMIISIQLNPSQLEQPITYDPLIGGVYFISTLLIFSIFALAGFFRSIYFKEFQDNVITRAHLLDQLGLFIYASTPLFMLMLRIFEINGFPFNFIFLPTSVGLCLHLIMFTSNPRDSGYPIHSTLLSLLLINEQSQTVIAGYTIKENEDISKLQGMAVLAVDNLMMQVLEQSLSDQHYIPNIVGNYGDILFIKRENYILIASFSGLGKKIGKFVMTLLLTELVKRIKAGREDIEFVKLLDKYTYIYRTKKNLDTKVFFD